MRFESYLSNQTGATRIKNREKIPKKLLLFKACERGNQLYVWKKIYNIGTTNNIANANMKNTSTNSPNDKKSSVSEPGQVQL